MVGQGWREGLGMCPAPRLRNRQFLNQVLHMGLVDRLATRALETCHRNDHTHFPQDPSSAAFPPIFHHTYTHWRVRWSVWGNVTQKASVTVRRGTHCTASQLRTAASFPYPSLFWPFLVRSGALGQGKECEPSRVTRSQAPLPCPGPGA